MLDIADTRPRCGDSVRIRRAVRIARDQPFDLMIGGHAGLVCWGVMPSRMLRHSLFVRWLDAR